MKKNKLSLRETFVEALKNYKKKNFIAGENLCNKICFSRSRKIYIQVTSGLNI